MNTPSPYPRMLAAGGGAIFITACLVFIMQALVLRGDVVLQEEATIPDLDIWMEDKAPELRPDRVVPVLTPIVAVPPMVRPPIADPRPNDGMGFEPEGVRPTAGEPDISFIENRGAYPKFRIQHQWPRRALDQGISGWVTIGFTISTTGSVKDAHVIGSSHRMFERKGLDAVEAYKYEPTIVQSRPLESPGQTIRVVWEITG
jgi:periplasmic protein TonB